MSNFKKAIMSPFAALLVGSSAIFFAPAANAATSSLAQSRCHATTDHVTGKTTVPSKYQHHLFAQDLVYGSDLLCGNGSTWGAVHIEVKHNVYSWQTFRECMLTVVLRNSKKTYSGSKTTYEVSYPGGSVIAVTGDNGLITAYPKKDSGSAKSWQVCADNP